LHSFRVCRWLGIKTKRPCEFAEKTWVVIKGKGFSGTRIRQNIILAPHLAAIYGCTLPEIVENSGLPEHESGRLNVLLRRVTTGLAERRSRWGDDERWLSLCPAKNSGKQAFLLDASIMGESRTIQNRTMVLNPLCIFVNGLHAQPVC
jgi:hypothetical protein